MAISKTQPMRSAEVEILEKVNALDTANAINAENITANSDSIADINERIGEGFSPSLTIARSLTATNAAIQSVGAEIGTGFDEDNTVTAFAETLNAFLGTREDLDDTVVNSIVALADAITTLNSFNNRFRIGVISGIEVPALESVSSSFSYNTPFEENDISFVVLGLADDLLQAPYEVTLIDSTYSGFSYSINNTDSDPATLSLGFMAVKVN